MTTSQESTAFKSSQWRTKLQIKTTPRPLETSWKCSVNHSSFRRTDSRLRSLQSWSTLGVIKLLKWFWTALSSHSMRRATCKEASIQLLGMPFRHFTSLSRAILKLTRSASNTSNFSESTQIQATRLLTWAIASSKASAQTSKSSTVRSLFTSVSRWGKQVSSRRTSLRLCLTDLRRWCLIRSWLRKTSLITT